MTGETVKLPNRTERLETALESVNEALQELSQLPPPSNTGQAHFQWWVEDALASCRSKLRTLIRHTK